MKLYLFAFFIITHTHIYGQTDTLENIPINATKITLWATYYYVPVLNHAEHGIDLLDEQGNNLGLKLDSCDWCKAAIEGTVFIKKENKNYVLNYAARSKESQHDCRLCAHYKDYDNYSNTGKILWAVSSGFGKGVKNYDLIPFKTIAVDSSIIPYGTVIYIPKAKGVEYINLQGETVKHDGFFFAGDTGSKIIGNHIDVFIGTSLENPFEFIKSSPRKTVEAYLTLYKKLPEQLKP
jgi:3D (Asp-Asp-Asp) domain-containing protein